MQLDFSKELVGISGDVIPKSNAEKGEAATLQLVCREALLASFQGENIEGSEKFKRWELAKKLEGKVELKVEEISKIKELVGKAYPPGVVGPVYEILEGNA